MSLALVMRTKVCASCGRRKPWSDFYVRTRWDDGSVRNVLAYCKPCHNRRTSTTPDAWQRIKGDPRRLARTRRRTAANMRTYRERRGRNVGAHTNIGPTPTVDAAPFVTWLRTLGDNAHHIATVTGLPDGTVRKLLRGDQTSIYLDTVDAALIYADTLTTLDDLYPLEVAA